MVLKAIINTFLTFAQMIFNLIPVTAQALGEYGQDFMTFVGYGIYFFGSNNFALVITNVMFWISAEVTWIIIEWFYKKIPGVD